MLRKLRGGIKGYLIFLKCISFKGNDKINLKYMKVWENYEIFKIFK